MHYSWNLSHKYPLPPNLSAVFALYFNWKDSSKVFGVRIAGRNNHKFVKLHESRSSVIYLKIMFYIKDILSLYFLSLWLVPNTSPDLIDLSSLFPCSEALTLSAIVVINCHHEVLQRFVVVVNTIHCQICLANIYIYTNTLHCEIKFQKELMLCVSEVGGRMQIKTLNPVWTVCWQELACLFLEDGLM